jgi:hypothetical protein
LISSSSENSTTVRKIIDDAIPPVDSLHTGFTLRMRGAVLLSAGFEMQLGIHSEPVRLAV